MRSLLLVSLLAACSHRAAPQVTPKPPAPHAQVSATVQAWLDHGSEPTLPVVVVINEGGRALVHELGLVLDGDYGGELAATVTRAQLAAIIASPAVIMVSRNYAVGIPPAALDLNMTTWLEEGTLEECQPTDGTATLFVQIDHQPTAAERTLLATAGVILDGEPHDPYIVTARITRTAAADAARGVPGVRLSLMPCMQLYDQAT